jgi:hypothetical protein
MRGLQFMMILFIRMRLPFCSQLKMAVVFVVILRLSFCCQCQ